MGGRGAMGKDKTLNPDYLAVSAYGGKKKKKSIDETTKLKNNYKRNK